MVIDGRKLSSDILDSIRGMFDFQPVVRAITCAPSAATLSYLKIKEARAQEAGMHLDVVRLPDSATEEEIIAAITEPGAHAIIVQLPLPPHLDTHRILQSIPVEKDADVLSERAYEQFLQDATDALLPPVVGAVREILHTSQRSIAGKRAVVVGQGKLVGLPVSQWLSREGAHVVVVTREQDSLQELQDAEIIVSGAGSAGIITPEHISEGVVLIDAGTSEFGGAVVGDADPACAEKAAVFTPVPGGVGPVAVACLFRNVALLLERSLQE